MNFIISAIKWLATTVMVIILLVGLSLYFVASTMIKVLPKSIDELTSVSATVKTSVVGPIASIITPQEYPTQIEIPGDVQNAEEANKRIKAGDKVSI